MTKPLTMIWAQGSTLKTGRIPQAIVGTTLEEVWESCNGCALRDSRECYAWGEGNTPVQGSSSVLNLGVIPTLASAKQKPENFTLGFILGQRAKRIRAVRLGVIGDPGRVPYKHMLEVEKAVRGEGLAMLGYTHFRQEANAQKFKHTLMASCDTYSRADAAIADGWRATVVLPWDFKEPAFRTLGNNFGIVCPAQMRDNVTCNDCRLCDPQHRAWSRGKLKLIGFIQHGRKVFNRKKRGYRQLPLFGEILT